MPFAALECLLRRLQQHTWSCAHSCARTELDLFVALRWLAEASYLDLAVVTLLTVISLSARIDSMLIKLDKSLQIWFSYKTISSVRCPSVGLSRGAISSLKRWQWMDLLWLACDAALKIWWGGENQQGFGADAPTHLASKDISMVAKQFYTETALD